MSFVPLVTAPADAPPNGRWYVVRKGEVLTDDVGEPPTGSADPGSLGLDLPVGDLDGPVFLGTLDGVPCWALGVPAEAPDPPGHRWQTLMGLGAAWGTDAWMLAGRAVQLIEWWRTSRFCGRCGTATRPAVGERAMHCPACQLSAYPRLAPAVIVLVRRGDEVLLAQGRGFRGMYSTLAGFVEPGETLEEAVHREVAEEVGVRLGAVRYFASQPWPFPHSLMVGFLAEWASGEIDVDGDEIVDAGWYGVDNLPPIPPRLSIARRLIDSWMATV